ncbi:glycosyltransferase family protein [Spirosoma validum]|uniref:Glycosyl transferase n=1 Tax=Spirosoma validum TaxID=2771355 RepID=A0A927B0Y0_9BACT|nr:hypothetical protein [Spirosoma validum]MBD2753318.1 hypothetical protein [Spirosoma validum]
MKTAFTICSNNYLAQAKVLGESFLRYHNSFEFIIGLVDGYNSEVDYKSFGDTIFIPVKELNIPNFNNLESQYNIVELNTAVKPFYFEHIFNVRKSNTVIYLDPDILVLSSFDELLDALKSFSIVLTPQSCTPIDDEHAPADIHLLATGTFNLGFIALSNYKNSQIFLNWWSKRVIKYGYDLPNQHMFFDQLLINLVPAFFDNYYILKHLGYNMAAWNMHERVITNSLNDNITINLTTQLRFFHFSGYKFNNPEILCKYSSRHTFDNRPDVKELFYKYNKLVYQNNYDLFSKLKPIYCTNKKTLNTKYKPNFIARIKKAVKNF